ncbi:MAG: GNAT family N-acetyltransferase [Calditrichota bacterium]
MSIAHETIEILPLTAEMRRWAAGVLAEHWGSERVVTRGHAYRADTLPGFIARIGGEPMGLITYTIEGRSCEIVTLNSLQEGSGIGTRLLEAVDRSARAAHCTRMWLITTNDNLPALRFYQRRGFTISAVYPNAVAESRRLKPEIPLIGIGGIPVRDEIEMERWL